VKRHERQAERPVTRKFLERDMKTLIFTKKDVEKVLTPSLANKTVEKAFKAYGLGEADMPAKSYLYF
jgi:ornithine cyclodeaminase/alanine dehydrogenase-like protein (mu-crystallin family)